MNTTQEIEAKKDRFDMRPPLKFVQRYRAKYKSALEASMPVVQLRSTLKIKFEETYELQLGCGPQVTPAEIERAVSHLPKSVRNLSRLVAINYEWARIVPVPLFDNNGDWKFNVDKVSLKKFPRRQDHPSRILTGRTARNVIFPTPIPGSVHENEQDRWYYQFHVFLHEFFHTVENTLRDPAKRAKVVLRQDTGFEFTYQKWWESWANLFTTSMTPAFPTRYASIYSATLNSDGRENNPVGFDHALAEQMCESFVGYILGIAPNDEDNPNFKTHSPQMWGLMDQLSTAKVISM